MSKFRVGVEALLEALVMIFLRALPDVGNRWERGQREVVGGVKARLVITLLTA